MNRPVRHDTVLHSLAPKTGKKSGRVVSSRHAGFTLVELMIAMTLVSILMTMIYTSFSVAVRSWESIDEISTDNEEMYAIQTFLFRKLSQIRPLSSDGKGKFNILFKGERQVLQFIATAPLHREFVDGLYQYHLSVDSDERGTSLQISYDRFPLVAESPDIDFKPVKLLDDLASIEFSYYGRLSKNSGAQWHREWTDGFRLPTMVRVEIERDNRLPPWPAFVIPLKSGAKL